MYQFLSINEIQFESGRTFNSFLLVCRRQAFLFNLLILYFMVLSQFFGVPLPRVYDDSDDLTILRIAKETDEGVSYENVILEKENNSLVGLDFRDFTITNLLKAGIKPTALHIEADNRFGLESEITRFNEFVDERAEEIFSNN